VLTVPEDSIRPAPDFGTSVETRFIHGVFQSRDKLVVGLDLEQLLKDGELAVPQAA
jgi:purine-binding chemotaxis protein CheW